MYVQSKPNISFKLDIISVAEFWQTAGRTAQWLTDWGCLFCFMCGLLSDYASRSDYIL